MSKKRNKIEGGFVALPHNLKEELEKFIPVESYYGEYLKPSTKSEGKQKVYFCRFHDDKNTPNFNVYDDGRYKCFACGNAGDILSFHQHITGFSFPETLKDLASKYAPHLLDEKGVKSKQRRIEATYDYHNENEELLFQVVRYTPKDFRQRRPDGKGGWIWNLKNVELVIYRLPEVLASSTDVLICEGEKDVDLLWENGFVATTCPMGAGKWKIDCNGYFEGRNVVIIPDNDDVGRKHAVQIAHSLKEIAESIKVVHLQNLKDHGDVSDFLDSHTVDELQIEIEKTAPYDFSQNDPAESGLNSLNSFYSHWGEVENFKNNNLPEIPAELLPDNYGKFAKALATATEVPEGLAVFGVLGVVSAAVSHRFCVSPKENWEEPINVYLLAALPPGNNKSSVLTACSKPLVTWEKEQAEKLLPKIKQAMSERKTMEKLIEKDRNLAIRNKDHDMQKLEIQQVAEMEAKLEDPPVLPKIFVTDATPESLVAAVEEQGGRLAVLSDEGGIMEVVSGLYSGGRANINIILNGIDGGYVRVERKDKSFDLSPYLTFCLFAQPVVISSMGGKKAFTGNGMLERFLYLLPQSKLGYRTHDTEPVSKALQERYSQQVIELLNEYMLVADGEEERSVLKLDDQSHQKWKEFQNQTEKEFRPNGKLHLISGWGGKISGFTLRIAGLIHVMKGLNVGFRIDHETMGNALILAAHLKEHALAAFGLMKTDEATHKACVVMDWIKGNGENTFLKSACHKALHGQFEDVRGLEDALDILMERNVVSIPESVTTGRGRPSIVYRVNPAVLSDIN